MITIGKRHRAKAQKVKQDIEEYLASGKEIYIAEDGESAYDATADRPFVRRMGTLNFKGRMTND